MGLLEKAQKKKGQTEKTIEEPKGLLEKAQQRKREKVKVPPSVISVKEEQSYDFIEELEEVLEKSQQRKREKVEEPPSVKGVKEEQSYEVIEETEGLLEKAQQRKREKVKVPPFVKGVKEEQIYEVIEEQSYDVIEEQKGFGWKKLSSKRIVYDHKINEYRYEVIEPQLNEEEKKTKKEISHLFKMLADVDTFDMIKEEKEKFLVRILEQIIIDNDIKFEESYPGKIFYDLFKDFLGRGRIDLVLYDDRIFLEETIGQILLENNIKFPESSKDKIFYHLFRDFLGYGRIDILMHDDGIEDISCDGPKTPIFLYHRKYEAIETNIYFNGEEELNSFIIKLCQISGKQISIYSPIVDGKLPDGSRLQATLARTVTKSSTFTIRKFKENPLTPIDLIEYKSLSVEMAAYFWMAIENGASMLFCGGTASGKTTALNALSLFIPASHKIVSIEDTREVSLPHKNWIAGTTRKGFSSSDENKTGKDIDMFDLIRAALRQRPRVIIVGEVRGREAYSLFQAMATGHTSYSTVHASTIYTLIQRLENPPISLPRALLTSLDVIVFQNAIEIGGKMVRRMTSITEIIKLDSDTNQLIFMAPFTWISKTDDRFESSKTSKLYNKIKQQNDWNDEQLEQELSNRMLVLKWMGEKDIRSYQEFGKVVADYQKYPKKVLEKAKKEMKG
jgi:flagellar protein FlaI